MLCSKDLWGLVLAGGLGTRLGGKKPFKKLAGHRLIDLSLASLVRICPQIIISANNILAYSNFSHKVLIDRWPGQGPLAALATAFLDSAARGLLIIAVDMPLVRIELLGVLARGYGKNKALIPIGPRWPEPLIAYYSRDCLSNMIKLLDQGERRPRMLLKWVDATFIPREVIQVLDPEGFSFININFLEDLKWVEQEIFLRRLIDTNGKK